MIEVYIDGLCKPVNLGGIAAYGLAVYRDGSRIHRDKGVVGEGLEMSNNVAEYAALCVALSWLKRVHSQEPITIMSDSQLLVNQMSGKWKAKSGRYLTYYKKAVKLASGFSRIDFKWIPREENTEADELSRMAFKTYGARAPSL